MSTTIEETTIPTGTWNADPVHSSVGFSVKHLAVGTFKGGFSEFQAQLVDGALTGVAQVASVRVQDENLNAHLQSPDFFDAERFPEIKLESARLRREGDSVVADGELELRGVKQPVHLKGTISGPAGDPYGNERIGLELETKVDRTRFGLNWNMELPNGGPAVGNEVTLTAGLELVKEA